MPEQFLNSIYRRAQYETDDRNGRLMMKHKDVLVTVIKDTESGETRLHFQEEPTIPVYLSVEHRTHPELSVPKAEVREVWTKYRDREKTIAQEFGVIDAYYNAIKNKTKYEFVQKMISSSDVYMADVDLEDYHKTDFEMKNGLHYGTYNKGFSDIEVDISKYDGFPDPEVAPCPINVISHLDQKSMMMYSFCLVTPETRSQIMDIMRDKNAFIEKFVHEKIRAKCTFSIRFFEDEQSLITAYWSMIHETKPDFVGIWNMRFDALTILNRMKRLRMEVAQTLCHPDVPEAYKFVYYDQEDAKKFSFGSSEGGDTTHPSRKFDWWTIMGYTQYYDQMSIYSNLRKRYLLPSYKLESIGQSEVKFGKVDLAELGYTIKDVNIKNYPLFLAYNIQDVFVQYLIEEKVEDLDKYIIYSGNTRLSKGTKVSQVIKNLLMKTFWQQGRVIGNNVRYEDDGEKPIGAIVARPELIEYKGDTILGQKSFVFNNVIDFDAASEYPSLMITFNITKSAIYGRIVGMQHPGSDAIIPVRGEINQGLETLETSLLDFCHDYLQLPSADELIGLIEQAAEKK